MNEEVGELIEREDQNHPRLNNLILEKLFECVRRRDLLACRGVNQKWNLLTIPFTRSEFTVGIQLSNRWRNHPRNRGEESTRRTEDFVTIFSRNELGIPFAKFELGPFCTREGIGQHFLELCGDTTTEIRLRQEQQGNESFKVEDVSELLRSMKKLERLTMCAKFVTDSRNVVELFPGSKPKLISFKNFTLESYDTEGLAGSCPTFIEELISAAENISDLSMKEFLFSSGYADDDIIPSYGFQALTRIEKLGRESSIRNLSLGPLRKRPHIELLRRMAGKQNGLKLKQLSFSMDLVEEESDQFQLIELFKDTLELLELISSSSSFMNFPRIPKLRRLSLKIAKDFDSSLVNLNKIFPILKELVLCQYDHWLGDQVFDEFLAQSEPCLTVKSLWLQFGVHLTSNAFNHVLTIFPRLTELRIQIEVNAAEILRQIWSRMTELKSLSICGNPQTTESMDSLFTGISAETFEGITGVVKDLDKLTIECRRETILKLRNQHCQHPSIGNLTNLRCLKLNVSGGENGGRSNYLSDVTGFLGFYSLKHLSRLVLQFAPLIIYPYFD